MSVKSRVLSDRYRVDELIGRGGMASVYRGQDVTLGRQVAIKILKRELAADPAFLCSVATETRHSGCRPQCLRASS